MNPWFQALLFVAVSIGCTRGNKGLQLEQKILNDIFNGYDRRVRPLGKNGTGPVIVEVNAYIRSLNDFDDVKMVYSAQLTFRQKWRDNRLRYESQDLDYVTITSPDRMWVPDIFFSNEMKSHFHKIMTPNNLVRIFPDGTVLYSTRVSLELFCPMNLRNYPMDMQKCGFRAASYGYTTKDIEFVWKDHDPVQVSSHFFLPTFDLEKFNTGYCTSKTNTGEYSCIRLDLLLNRQFTFHLIQAFMPSMSLVFMSWVVFWLHPRSTVTRLGIWLGILVSMVIVTTSVAESGPRVSYIKAMDVWMGTCVLFVFCVLVEIGLVNNAVSKEDLRSQAAMEEAMLEHKNTTAEDGANDSKKRYKTKPLRWLNKYSTRALRIDAISRFLFPASFAFFNLIYWLTYTSMSETDG